MKEIPDILYGSEHVVDNYTGKVIEVNKEGCNLITQDGTTKYLDKYAFAEYKWNEYEYWELVKCNLPEIDQIIQVVETHADEWYGIGIYIKLLNNVSEAVPIPENYYILIQERTDYYQI